MNAKLQIVMFTYGLPFTDNTLDQQALGGAETAFIYIGRELAKLGHQVTAFCVCTQPGSFNGVHYQHIDTFESWRKSSSCDLFICSRFYQVFAQKINAKVKVLWLHDHLVEANVPELSPVLPQIDYLYCVSNYHKEYIGKLIPAHKNKIHVTHNGVDHALIDSIRQVNKGKRHKMMYISRPERGIHEALNIFQKLNDKSLEFLICSYPYPNEQMGQQLDPVARQFIQQGFNLQFGQFSKADLYQHITESKLVIYPSNTPEVFCIAAVEAQACGTVFLARELGALAETVGYPCQKGTDPTGFFNATQQVLASPDFRMVLEQMGLQHARQFSWDRVAKQFVDEASSFSNQLKTEKSPSHNPTIPLSPKSLHINKTPPLASKDYPLISCLTVTKDRIVLLKESIQCFLTQSYPNKELIIVAMGDKMYHKALESYIEKLEAPSLKLIWAESEDYSLGKARNQSLQAASGDVICIWDDDDLYHPERLMSQYQHMIAQGAEGCCLTDFLQFFQKDQDLFWVDWKFQGNLQGHDAMLPGSLMAIKKSYFQYPETGDKAHIAEDNFLMDQIAKRIKIVGLDDCGYLYVYRYHSRNVHPENHHRRVGAYGNQTADFLKKHGSQLMEALQIYSLPQPVKVKERGGEIFYQYLD
ncbi:MAG: glycosyltransferase [Saprospiraceae bacterium]|nr:glycosyltransferase [Saprospiraceae bacterium]